ncbi:helix-turn-helix transcriptional regulator [Flavobacterium sp. Fl-318]|jgi:transcriptional regulator with XRE-family HTH domain|uniref:Helix-turn-helix transcriptional regulator n=1 Tax=Flavobacterium cupriresistens TaxID=2893885 RepID=A0ABU4R7Q7_9FLAO|nr:MULTISPECIES: helix-turn-helix transcriptional regulator [unclassified Flavobacterium]MDX6188073.1 helix-turn-helix transcriptional regulator [Flavobacterium sp. Fl-318]UFH42007.1 helix-turn-helix domain-containing protein [Flavobacterium sp. F-323]
MRDFKGILYYMIGNRIKSLRTERSLSQEDLSLQLNLSRASISNIELGRHQIPLFLLYELSLYFKIDIHDLIPSIEEIQSNLNSNSPELSKILDTQNLDLSQKVNLENILNSI